MERETISLNAREQSAAGGLNQVERGGLTGEGAARLMGLSLRRREGFWEPIGRRVLLPWPMAIEVELWSTGYQRPPGIG